MTVALAVFRGSCCFFWLDEAFEKNGATSCTKRCLVAEVLGDFRDLFLICFDVWIGMNKERYPSDEG